MTQSVSRDQRVFERLNAELPGRIKKQSSDCECSILAKNLSAQGVNVLTTENFSLEDRVSLVFKNPRTSSSLDVKGRVVWMDREEPYFWKVGVRFDKIDFMQTSCIFNILP